MYTNPHIRGSLVDGNIDQGNLFTTYIGDDGSMSYSPQLEGEYEFDEVTSAMQKCIRRGLEYEALYFAYLLEKKYPWYVWKRLRITCCEDIEDMQVMVYVDTCYHTYKDLVEEAKKKGKFRNEGWMFLAAAVLHMCRAKKSSVNSDFGWWVRHTMKEGYILEVPDFAVDGHTARGRSMGRGDLHFVTEGGLHANEDRTVDNPYLEWGNATTFKEEGLDPEGHELHPSISDAKD